MLMGAGRATFGAALLLQPEAIGRGWVGAVAGQPGARVALRAAGARDLILGLGVLLASRRGGPIRGWLEAGMAADLADCAITLGAFRDLPAVGRFATLAVAGGSAYVSSRLAATADAAVVPAD